MNKPEVKSQYELRSVMIKHINDTGIQMTERERDIVNLVAAIARHELLSYSVDAMLYESGKRVTEHRRRGGW